MEKSITEIYGNRVRLRVCGLCQDQDRLLMIKHTGLTADDFWAPPGGGVEFGFTAEENLVREFKEETSLKVQVGSYLFSCEFIKPPLHAVEIFFAVTILGGRLNVGQDPEMKPKDQIIKEAKFMAYSDIDALPAHTKHGAFGLVTEAYKITELRGYFKI